MTRIAALSLMLLTAAAPAMSEHSPTDLLDRAQRQVHQLDREIDQVRHPELRRSLEEKVARLDRTLDRLERTGALEPRYGPDRRGADHGYGRPGPRGLSFHESMQLVRVESFDSRKLEVIQRLARTGRFTTDQARSLAAQLTFDSKKAEALIALYPAVVDPDRYVLALDVLDFGSSKRRVAQTLRL
jgi:hypothetical protein